jgi:hypothetical protein
MKEDALSCFITTILTTPTSSPTAARTEGPVVHGPAPHEAVVSVEVALAKANANPSGNHASKSILELLSHVEHTLIHTVRQTRHTAAQEHNAQEMCSACPLHLLQRSLGVVPLGVFAE